MEGVCPWQTALYPKPDFLRDEFKTPLMGRRPDRLPRGYSPRAVSGVDAGGGGVQEDPGGTGTGSFRRACASSSVKDWRNQEKGRLLRGARMDVEWVRRAASTMRRKEKRFDRKVPGNYVSGILAEGEANWWAFRR